MLDASTALTDPAASPSPGDITLCIGCGTVLEYDRSFGALLDHDKNLRVRLATPETREVVFREHPKIKRLSRRLARGRLISPKTIGNA